MNRNRVIIGFVAALALVVGGIYAADNAFACGNKTTTAEKANATEATSAEVTTVQADGACGAMKASAKTASAKGACMDNAKKADVEMASAKGSCAKGVSADAKGHCSAKSMKTAELMDGETTLSTLVHCGIDVNSANTADLAAKLAEGHCGMYSAKQWATMIDAAKNLDAQTSKAVLTTAKSEKQCSGKECPISLVAKELAQRDVEQN